MSNLLLGEPLTNTAELYRLLRAEGMTAREARAVLRYIRHAKANAKVARVTREAQRRGLRELHKLGVRT